MSAQQLDVFDPDPDEVERLAPILFDAWSAAWVSVPNGVRWADLKSERPKDMWRSVARAALIEQASRPSRGVRP